MLTIRKQLQIPNFKGFLGLKGIDGVTYALQTGGKGDLKKDG